MTDYTIIIEEGKNNFSSYCPDIPGVIATGKTLPEVTEKMKEAIMFHLEGLRECGIETPVPHVRAVTVPV